MREEAEERKEGKGEGVEEQRSRGVEEQRSKVKVREMWQVHDVKFQSYQ